MTAPDPDVRDPVSGKPSGRTPAEATGRPGGLSASAADVGADAGTATRTGTPTDVSAANARLEATEGLGSQVPLRLHGPPASPADALARMDDPFRVSELAFDLLPDAYLILDGRYRVLLGNRRYLALLGQKLEDVRGFSVYDINQAGSQAQRDARRAWLDGVLTGLAPGETRTSAPLHYVLGGSAARPAPEDRFWQITATRTADNVIVLRVNDVSAQLARDEAHQRERAKLRSQARLRQVLAEEANTKLGVERERLEQLLAFSKVGAWVFDVDSDIIECTEQVKLNLGLRSDDTLTLSRYLHALVHVDDRPALRAAIRRAVDSGATFEVEHRVVWPDGSLHWLLVRGVPNQVQAGRVRAMAAFSLDITARKERELRGEALAAEDRAARAQSERVREAMDRFIMTVSHELRSPLQAIVSWSSLLRVSADPKHVASATAAIDRSARQLSHLVDDLLDGGAIVSGRLSIRPAPVELAALAASVAEDIRATAEGKGLSMRVDALEPCIVMGDESRLRQIVWNLLTNAVKFTSEGGIAVAVTTDAGQACLSVRDTGSGLAPEMLESVFERFRQAHVAAPGQRAGNAGLGLGLWLVRSLTQLHGGTVRAESDGPGRGATFTVRLPLHRPA